MMHAKDTTKLFVLNPCLLACAGLALAAAGDALAGGPIFIRNYVGTDNVGYWSEIANWSTTMPTVGDGAWIGDSAQAENAWVYLDMDALGLYSLDITDGMALRTNGYTLEVLGHSLSLQGKNVVNNTSYYPRLIVDDGPDPIDADIRTLFMAVNEGRVEMNDQNAVLRVFRGMTINTGTAIQGHGTIIWDNDNAFDSFWNMGLIAGSPGGTLTLQQAGTTPFNLDGDGGEPGKLHASVWNMNEETGSHLVVNATALSDDFDGEMIISPYCSIHMNVAADWTLGPNGHITMFGDENGQAVLGGTTMTMLGTLETYGADCLVEADVMLLNGGHTILNMNDGLTFTGNTIANTSLFTIGSGSTLNFAGPSNLTGNGFDLDNGTITGAIIQNTGGYGIRGRGTVDNRVINDAVFYADGGTLLINGFVNDWDGIGDGGELRAQDGDLHLTDHVDADFAGDMYIFPDREIFIDGFAMTLTPAGYLYNWDGTLRATDLFTIAGQFDAIGAVDIDADVQFTSTSTTISGDRLNLNQNAFIQAGASINAVPGGLIVGGASGMLELDHGSIVDADVQGQGLILIDAAIGQATVNDNFYLIGTLALQLGLPSPGRYDHLTVADTFEARGHIDVVMFGYEPQLGDEYDVLDFVTFNDLGYTMALPQLPAVLDWDVTDFETAGVLRVAQDLCPADFDDNAGVDVIDLLSLLAAWGLADPAFDLNDDGIVDVQDLLALLASWGSC